MKSVSEFAPTTVLCLHSFRGSRHGRNLYPKHLNVTCLYREWQDLKDKNAESLGVTALEMLARPLVVQVDTGTQ